ncbi:hypothetical protein GCM10023147_14100 [Tsukamurella soli]|uniref:Polyketide cyclase / dehydrase and lipid transport n=1 Tax=Tsukamurella soli TaxID=644556 RepID=A0ABP8JCM0_9ACTN
MSTIQVADVAFVAATPRRVAAALAGERRWRTWFPDLRLSVTDDRGERGLRWGVQGALAGTSEMWIEPALDGVLLHYFLHAEPTGAPPPAEVAAETRARRVAGRSAMLDVKFTAEEGRALGEPALTDDETALDSGKGHR